MENNLKIPKTEGEIIEFYLSPEKTPVAYERKVRCLMLSGIPRMEAERDALTAPLSMELLYDIGRGLFALESEAVANIPIYNPYTGEEIPKEEETEDPKD